MNQTGSNVVFTNLASDLFLVKQTIPSVESKVEVAKPTNHIWIYDRSGSMTHLLPELTLDLLNHVSTLKDGDTLTLGWFSSQGRYDFMLKGMLVHQNLDNIRRLVLANNSAIALTCFSEILKETAESVIQNLVTAFGERISLMFFTDGYPVVSDYSREIDAIMRACRAMNAKLTSAILVGYGEYYNRQVLGDMASSMGASVIHSSELADFSAGMAQWISSGSAVEPKRKISLDPYGREVLFTNINGNINLYDPLSSEILVPMNVGELWSLQQDHPIVGKRVTPKDLECGLYAAASASINAMKPHIALMCVGKLGDVDLIDQINNAWTNAEFGKASRALAYAAEHEDGRYASGKNTKYVPKPDAFCVMDALNVLMADEGARFAPKSNLFKYTRIGVATKPKEGYPTFTANTEVLSPMDLTWNKSRLNLSILVRIPGTVDLGPDATKFGFTQVYPTFVFRNYAVIKDGVLNLKVLPVTMSGGTFAILQTANMIEKSFHWEQGRVYPVNLTKAPLVNRKIADTPLLAMDHVMKLSSELTLMARAKVYKAFYEHYYPKAERQEAGTALTKEQTDFLASKGITARGFAPPVVEEPSTDHYMAKDFTVAIKGFSSLPKVFETISKEINGGKLTPSEELIFQQYRVFAGDSKIMFGDTTPNRGENWFEVAIREINNTLRNLRKQLLNERFVVLAGKRWFADLTERDGAVVKYDGKEFTFNIKDIEVEY